MKTYKFKISHDTGSFKLSVNANDLDTAQLLITKAENCPISALTLISETEQLYKVVKLMRISGRREIIERHLTESEAQRVVTRYPDSNRSMVVYEKQ